MGDETMFCQKCGNKITHGTNFCPKCGATLYIEKVKHSVEERAKYDVLITDLGKDKYLALKTLIEFAGFDLQKAHEFIDNFPKRIKKIKKSVMQEEAKSIQVAFTKIGARVILKYCKHCGEALVEDSNHCGTCGGAVTIITPDNALRRSPAAFNKPYVPNQSSGITRMRKQGSLYCPKCMSQKLQTVVESHTKSTGGGYGMFKGCLGWLLLGPFGVLCGLCGSEVNVDTTNKTFFLCMNCSNKFREATELIKEKSQSKTWCLIGGSAITIIALIVFFPKDFWDGLLVLVGGGGLIFSSFKTQKDIEDIQDNKYEAKCYKS